MIPLRIIPLILLDKNKVVKTKQFKFDKYIGDPINSIKIFNDKNIDEIVIIDISATKLNRINFNLLSQMREEFQLPVSYGGFISNISDAKKLIELGIEKIILNTNSFNYTLIEKLVKKFGSQSISICIDIQKINGKYFLYNYTTNSTYSITIKEHLTILQNLEVGEIIIQNVDKDGMMNGYDIELLTYCKNLINCEIVCLGGMGNLNDISKVTNETAIKSFAIGSYFLYTSKLKSVLLNYISKEDRAYIIKNIKNGQKYV